jgi:sulfocyanin
MKASFGSVMRRMLATAIAAAVAAAVPMTAGFAAPAHSVDVSIVAGKADSDGGFDFNGYQKGAMTVTVPVGWRVVVHFTNAHDLPHSLAVLPVGAEKQPAPSAAPVFSGATTKELQAGLPKGAKQTFAFEASTPGSYEFVCGVPGHSLAGMWDRLVVSPTADAPSVTPPGAATLVVDSN